jgi:hypothetical protein
MREAAAMSKMRDGSEQDLFGTPEDLVVDTETPELPLEAPPPRVVKLTSAKRAAPASAEPSASPAEAAVVVPPPPAELPTSAPPVAAPVVVAEPEVPEPVKKPVRLQSSRKSGTTVPAKPVESAPPAEPETSAVPEVAEVAPSTPAPPREAISSPVAASVKVETPTASAPTPVAAPPAEPVVKLNPHVLQSVVPATGRIPEVNTEPALAQKVAPAKSAAQEPSSQPARQHPRSMRLTGHSGHPPTRGHLLQEARVRCDLSFEQVALATKIKKQFLEALEQDDADRLPPEVYVKAYVRRLCHHYGLDEEEVFALAVAPPPKPVDKAIPNEILQHIEEGKQVNPQEEKKIRNLTWGAAAAAGLLVVAGLGLYLGSRNWHRDDGATVAIAGEEAPILVQATEDMSAANAEIALELERRSPPAPPLVMSELPLPGSGKVQ